MHRHLQMILVAVCSEADIYLYGGCLTSWKVANGKDLLFVRPDAVFNKKKPIRFSSGHSLHLILFSFLFCSLFSSFAGSRSFRCVAYLSTIQIFLSESQSCYFDVSLWFKFE